METVLIRAEIIFRSEIRVTLCVITLPTFQMFFLLLPLVTSAQSHLSFCCHEGRQAHFQSEQTFCNFCKTSLHVCLTLRHARNSPVPCFRKKTVGFFFVSVKLCFDHLTKNSKTILYTQCVIQHRRRRRNRSIL